MSNKVIRRITAVVTALVISVAASFAAPQAAMEAQAAPVLARGIDVSHYQGPINWTAVAQSGITFAFVRVGTSNTIDTQYVNNLTGAAAAGLRAIVF